MTTMLAEELLDSMKDYIRRNESRSEFLAALEQPAQALQKAEVAYLAQGEYNLNYTVTVGTRKFVLRINTGSQMLLENQIAYEYKALQLLSVSGVTPCPYYLDDSRRELPYGLLIMEFLPGDPLDYSSDLRHAARTLARIHGLDFNASATEFLVKEPGPFTGIYNEVERLLDSYLACSRARSETARLLKEIFVLAGDRKKGEQYLLAEPWLRVINTELNSHNFIVNRQTDRCFLIDWEKPIYGEPAQDLSMFLIPTTTLWKRDYILSREEKEDFLDEYRRHLPPCLYADTLRDRVEMFTFFTQLRAVAWCAMAWAEYTSPGRPLSNDDTFQKIKMYIEPEFLNWLFKAYIS
ncbi:MAG TPA: aminoglycoside phosphotransferase family protein [Syntrophomonas sp.]|nr:aminoglycoside phosphotransferase family protein [Syntrophomonas sp.]